MTRRDGLCDLGLHRRWDPPGLLTLVALPIRQLSNSIFLTAALALTLPGPKHPHQSPAGTHLKAFLLRASRSPTPTALATGQEHWATKQSQESSGEKSSPAAGGRLPSPSLGGHHKPQLVVHHSHPAPRVPGDTLGIQRALGQHF